MLKSPLEMLQFDRDHIWHPYTSAVSPLPTYLVESAKGCELTLSDGTKLIDGMASWWCAIHGYNHERLNNAAKSQLANMSHVMFGGITHRPAIELCHKLIEITPSTLEHVFLADSGSISVEVAMKMAVQYWQANSKPNKCKMLSLKGGYHGDTFAAMSVCDPDTGMHHLFNEAVTKQFFCEKPSARFEQDFDPNSTTAFETVISQNHESIAAVILEPIVQGAGGMWFYHPSYLKKVRALCDEYSVLLIADEIATGFGRTGKLFACEWANIVPDILCLGKALTGGYMTLAATLTSAEIARGISAQDGVFMHGPTFMGNPLACAVAKASLDLLFEQDWKKTVKTIESQLNQELLPGMDLRSVKDVRVLGAIGVIELHEKVDVAKAQRFFVERGAWIRPFGNLLYVMPPYVIKDKQLTQLTTVMLDFAINN